MPLLKHTLTADCKHSFDAFMYSVEMSYGKRLQQAIGHAKTSRQKLATALEISVQAVGDVINGKTRAFTADNNAKAARFLGVSSDWLASDEGEMLGGAKPPYDAPSPLANELARFFDDCFPDFRNHKARTVGYQAATAAIQRAMRSEPDGLPSGEPERILKKEKRHA